MYDHHKQSGQWLVIFETPKHFEKPNLTALAIVHYMFSSCWSHYYCHVLGRNLRNAPLIMWKADSVVNTKGPLRLANNDKHHFGKNYEIEAKWSEVFSTPAPSILHRLSSNRLPYINDYLEKSEFILKCTISLQKTPETSILLTLTFARVPTTHFTKQIIDLLLYQL